MKASNGDISLKEGPVFKKYSFLSHCRRSDVYLLDPTPIFENLGYLIIQTKQVILGTHTHTHTHKHTHTHTHACDKNKKEAVSLK